MQLEKAAKNMAANYGAELPEAGSDEQAAQPIKEPERYITIPVTEYIYLNRIDSMMDVILEDSGYTNSATVSAVKDAVKNLRHAMNTAEAVAVE